MAAKRRALNRRRSRADTRRGFTYVALMIVIAIVGLIASASLQLGALLQRRGAEEALLVVGAEFSAALDSYAKATPAGLPTAPPSLQALLRDPRFPGVVRHLRSLPFDPLTGSATWGVVKTPDEQGIVGIYSLSPSTPIKVGQFAPAFRGFDGKTSYADWIFVAPSAIAVAAPAASAASGAS